MNSYLSPAPKIKQLAAVFAEPFVDKACRLIKSLGAQICNVCGELKPALRRLLGILIFDGEKLLTRDVTTF